MPFVIRVAIQATPGREPALLQQLFREEVQVPRQFEGCTRYQVAVAPDDDAQVLLLEEWTDRAAFEAYRGSPYFAEAASVLMPLLAGPPDSAYFEAELVGP